MQYQGHTLRHELKYYINASVYHTLRNRLRVVLKPDPNMKREDGYLISSLYFDDFRMVFLFCYLAHTAKCCFMLSYLLDPQLT